MVSWKSLGKLFGRGGGSPAEVPDCQFAIDLLRAFPGQPKGFVLSPESFRMALGMALSGARGDTARELGEGLRLGAVTSEQLHASEAARLERWETGAAGQGPPYALHAANGLFVSKKVKLHDEAAAFLRATYRAQVEALDTGDPAGSAERVNRWVSEATRGLVPELVGPGSFGPDTRLLLANALYFKGDWATKFAIDATAPAPFSLASGEKVPVPTMHQTAKHRVWTGPDAELLEMAYRGGELAMTFVLPKAGGSLAALEAGLSEGTLRDWLSRLDEETVRVAVPRFALDIGAVASKGALARLGIASVFDGAKADLSGLAEGPLAIDEVLHRARLTVTEEGTEAAAATVMFASQSLDRRKLRAFAVDRPFLFLLRDRQGGGVLFLGRTLDPR